MDKEKINLLRKVVKYDTKRTYIGKFTAENLDAAYRLFKRSQNWDKPVTEKRISIGKIDGTIICRALWYEMSYNPKRFGTVSPFLHNGKENIYRFCDKHVPETTPGFEVVETLRHKMIGFMSLNGYQSGQWNDVIDANNGEVRIEFIDNHSDDNYKKLSLLREMVHVVTTQNMKDWNRKAYRDEIIKVIESRHPSGVRGNKQVWKVQDGPAEMTPEEAKEDRMDKAAESAQITMDSEKYRPFDEVEQLRSDMDGYLGAYAHGKVR